MNQVQEILKITNQLKNIAEQPNLRIEGSPKAYYIIKKNAIDLEKLSAQYEKILPDRGIAQLYLGKLKDVAKGLNKILENLESSVRDSYNLTKYFIQLINELTEICHFLSENFNQDLSANFHKPFTLVKKKNRKQKILRDELNIKPQASTEPKKLFIVSKEQSSSDLNTISKSHNQVFISYCQEDGYWLKRLQVHLRPLEREGIGVWDDTKIKSGAKWQEEITKAIESAKVAVLLVSADFFASDYISNDELPPLLAAAEIGRLKILSIIVSPCSFEQKESLSKYQAINPPDQPLNKMNLGEQEEVFVRATENIKNFLEAK